MANTKKTIRKKLEVGNLPTPPVALSEEKIHNAINRLKALVMVTDNEPGATACWVEEDGDNLYCCCYEETAEQNKECNWVWECDNHGHCDLQCKCD